MLARLFRHFLFRFGSGIGVTLDLRPSALPVSRVVLYLQIDSVPIDRTNKVRSAESTYGPGHFTAMPSKASFDRSDISAVSSHGASFPSSALRGPWCPNLATEVFL